MNIGDKAPEILSKDSAASHVKFKEKYELPFPLIADINLVEGTILQGWCR